MVKDYEVKAGDEFTDTDGTVYVVILNIVQRLKGENDCSMCPFDNLSNLPGCTRFILPRLGIEQSNDHIADICATTVCSNNSLCFIKKEKLSNETQDTDSRKVQVPEEGKVGDLDKG